MPRLIAARDTGAMVAVVLLSAAFFAVFFRWFFVQFGPNGFSLNHPEDWGHAFIVPLISGFYIWKHRKEIVTAPAGIYWPGLVLLMAGLVCYPYFVLVFRNHMFQGFSILLVLSGLVLLLGGPRIFGVLAFPITYLGLGITISERVMNEITFKLKLLATQGSNVLLTMIGVDNDISGNLLKIYPGNGADPIPLNVAEACSGMRMVIAFIALAVAVAFLSCRYWWQRVAVMLLAVPVALFMNVIRVAVLGVLSLIDPGMATGEAHTFIGTLLLIPAFGLFMGCVWALKRMVDDPNAEGAKD